MTGITIERPKHTTSVIIFKHALLAQPWRVRVGDHRTDAGDLTIVSTALDRVILMLEDQWKEADVKRTGASHWDHYPQDSLVSLEGVEGLASNGSIKSGTVVAVVKHRLLKEAPLSIPIEVCDLHPHRSAMCDLYYMLDRFYFEATILQEDIRKKRVPLPEVEQVEEESFE
jgi:hypothetical protein